MKITLQQSTYGTSIAMYIESSVVCTRIHTYIGYDPYEELYIWLGQIRDLQLPASMVIDEVGHGVELIAENVEDETYVFRIEPWFSEDSVTRFSTIFKPYELIRAFHDGITEFLKDEYRLSDWSYIGSINWSALLKLPTISQNWQQRISLEIIMG
jgi:hypothetical protein